MEPDRTPRYLQSGGRPDRAGAPDRGRADPLLAHATRPQPTRAVPRRERLDQASELRRDRPVEPESPAPRPPGPAPRSAHRRAQPPAARGRLRASLSGAALRRGGDAAASGVARAAARGARAEPGFDRRRALEPDRVQSSRVASLGRGRPGAPRATDQHAPPGRSPGRPAADLVDDRRVQRAADSPAEAEAPRGRRSRPRQAHRGGRVLPSRRAAGRPGDRAGGLAQAADPPRRGQAVHGHRHPRSAARRHGREPRDRNLPADGPQERRPARRAQCAPICLSTRPHTRSKPLSPAAPAGWRSNRRIVAVPFTRRNIKEDLEDVGSNFDGAPDLEFRLATEALELEQSGLGYQRVPPGYRFPYGHTHKKQEEVYVVVRGSGRMKLDDEVVEVNEWDVVRVPPGTWRGYEAGPEGLQMLVIGAPGLGAAPRDDVDGQRDWWAD